MENKLYTAKSTLQGFQNYSPVGELYCDYCPETGEVRSYYIRDYYVNKGHILYNDIPVDVNSVKEYDVAEIGCDLSDNNDITYYMGEYLTNNE